MDRVESWDDPYENYFLKEDFRVKLDNGWHQLKADSEIPVLFGQSWTILQESDALWRIYFHNKDSVRIETTARKLLDTVYVDDDSMASLWLGLVDYSKDIEDLHKEAIKECEKDTYQLWQEYLPATLFNKRPAFSHEKEFRVI